MSKVTSADLLAAAKAAIEFISVEDAKALANDDTAVFVDVRDSKELEAGAIPGAIHAPRGGLEFALDPASDFAVTELTSGTRLVRVCGSGGRASFATKLAKDMGHDAVCLEGGFKAWKTAGGEVV